MDLLIGLQVLAFSWRRYSGRQLQVRTKPSDLKLHSWSQSPFCTEQLVDVVARTQEGCGVSRIYMRRRWLEIRQPQDGTAQSAYAYRRIAPRNQDYRDIQRTGTCPCRCHWCMDWDRTGSHLQNKKSSQNTAPVLCQCLHFFFFFLIERLNAKTWPTCVHSPKL